MGQARIAILQQFRRFTEAKAPFWLTSRDKTSASSRKETGS
jgi:hypothetical protein